ncbi:MAG: outer membrane lipoprotein-sorting protein [Treponema sp.]|nr:outer membrane lipoprotein-sorting protein [Treponema sp.]
MKKNLCALFFTLIASALVYSQTPTAMELLRRVDNNEVFQTIQYQGEMIIEYQNRRVVKTMNAWARGNEDSFIEFTNREDLGSRYLKTGGRLFFTSPDTERAMVISGHMLRESMMGSDLSYEDTLDNIPLSERYSAQILRTETHNGRPAWVLELTANDRSESYSTRRLWIDQEHYDVLRQEMFALSGAMLKEYNLIQVDVIDGRRFPVETEFRDLLRRGSSTRFIMRNVILDQPIADSIFTVRNLER